MRAKVRKLKMKRTEVKNIPTQYQRGATISTKRYGNLSILENAYTSYSGVDDDKKSFEIYRAIAEDTKHKQYSIRWESIAGEIDWTSYTIEANSDECHCIERFWTDKYGDLTLTQPQYIELQHTYPDGEQLYKFQAVAEDELGNEYMLRWDINNPEYAEDCDACDWDEFTVQKI